MQLVLDSTVVSKLCTPRAKEDHEAVARWLATLLREHADRVTVVLPEVVDYEVRRGLLHLALKDGRDPGVATSDLDSLSQLCEYLALDTPTMRLASQLWAEARGRGTPTADPKSLDGDVVLAAQARAVDGTVVTDNVRHLEQFGPVKRWEDFDGEDPS